MKKKHTWGPQYIPFNALTGWPQHSKQRQNFFEEERTKNQVTASLLLTKQKFWLLTGGTTRSRFRLQKIFWPAIQSGAAKSERAPLIGWLSDFKPKRPNEFHPLLSPGLWINKAFTKPSLQAYQWMMKEVQTGQWVMKGGSNNVMNDEWHNDQDHENLVHNFIRHSWFGEQKVCSHFHQILNFWSQFSRNLEYLWTISSWVCRCALTRFQTLSSLITPFEPLSSFITMLGRLGQLSSEFISCLFVLLIVKDKWTLSKSY